jgi:hypothetical protein
MKIKTNAIRLAEIQEFATWTHQEMDEAAKELRAQDAVIDRLIKTIGDTLRDQKPIGYADKHDLEREGHDFWVSRQQGKNTVPIYMGGSDDRG